MLIKKLSLLIHEFLSINTLINKINPSLTLRTDLWVPKMAEMLDIHKYTFQSVET